MPSLHVRLSPELHELLVRSAKREHRSLQAEMRLRLEMYDVLVGTVLAGAEAELAAGASTENARVAKAGRSELPSAADTVAPAVSSVRKEMCQHRVPPGQFCKRCD